MAHQEDRAEPQPPLVRQIDISDDLVVDQSRGILLEFLEYLFSTLVLLNKAYHHMHPTPDPHSRCKHKQPGNTPKHLTEMAGQAERLAFIGMLLRTADLILYLKSTHGENFASVSEKLEEEKPDQKIKQRPDISHGLAVLNFLTAGICRNNMTTLCNLRDLVHALRESAKKCKHSHPPIQIAQFFKENSSKCIMRLIKALLDQCPVCEGAAYDKEMKARLTADAFQWDGCGDCESILVDVLVYAKMLSVTNFRMMASTRLHFDYYYDCTRVRAVEKEIKKATQDVAKIHKHLIKLGFTWLTPTWYEKSRDGLLITLSAEYEVLFISGWQDPEEKKDEVDTVLLKGFLERKRKRPFFIQCCYQLQRSKQEKYCCEPQMKSHLENVIKTLQGIPRKAIRILNSVHMILEEDPCEECEKSCTIPTMVIEQLQMRPRAIPYTLVTMLPYDHGSTFSQRLTEVGGPVQLKDDLCPFDERHECMVNKRCRHVRCHQHCQYSKPSKVLALSARKLRPYNVKY